MDHHKHYASLIARSRDRQLDGYKERHHILPRCMGGSNHPGNIALLSAREHYVAHQLLVKIYPHVKGLVWAAIRQSRGSRSSRAYKWLKEKQAVIVGDARRGGKLSAAHKQKLTDSRRGGINSPDHRAKISAALMGHRISDTTRAKISAANAGRKGTPLTLEQKEKISVRKTGNKDWLGKKHSMETREKMSASARACWRARREQLCP